MRLLDEGANLVFDGEKNATANGQFIPLIYTYDVNLRNIIGKDEYDNNDYFAICLNSVATYMFISSYQISGVVSGQGASTTAQIGISGLPFINSTTNNLIDNTVLFPDIFAMNGGTVNPYGALRNFFRPKTKKIIFRKPQNSNVTITIGFFGCRGTTPSNFIIAGHSGAMAQTTANFSFTIFPVVEE